MALPRSPVRNAVVKPLLNASASSRFSCSVARYDAVSSHEGGDARVDELRKDLDAAQVARAQQVLAHIGELLAVFVHEGIRQAARLRAQTAVGAAPADERREQALPRLADAQRTVHEALEVHAEAAQLLDLRDAQLAGERNTRGAQLAGELDAPRPADVHLRRRV